MGLIDLFNGDVSRCRCRSLIVVRTYQVGSSMSVRLQPLKLYTSCTSSLQSLCTPCIPAGLPQITQVQYIPR